MRLRLRIERNQQPPAQIIWGVPDTSITVAQLLEQINAFHPLEADTWGLEDYKFASGGYELMHFNTLKGVLKDEDELVIRPYTWEERRARTALGRDQISADGRHLHDGIAFGKPFIRTATRPRVNIPPMKKRKLDHGREEQVRVAEADEAAKYAIEDNVQDEPMNDFGDGEEDEDDEDFQPEHSGGQGSEERDDFDKFVDDLSDISTPTATSDDGESVSSSSEASSSSESSSDDEDESDLDADADEEWEGIEDTPPASATLPKTSKSGLKSTLEKIPPEADTTPQTTSQTQLPSSGEVSGIPNEGLARTHGRNVRRREAKRLKYYKEQGLVPQNMTLAELRQLQDDGVDIKSNGGSANNSSPTQVNGNPQGDADAAKAATSEAGKAAATDGANDTEPAKKRKAKKVKHATEPDVNFEEERQKLLNAIQTGGVDVNGTEDPEQNEDAPEEITSRDQAALEGDGQNATTMVPPSVSGATRRSKLDLDGSKRLLFGHLGVRVPKNQEQKDALQQKLAEKSKRKAVQRGDVTASNGDHLAEAASQVNGKQSAPDTSESWRDKINLTAVECADEGVTLSGPPFPFRQGWDSQYNRKGKKRASSAPAQQAGQKRKRNDQQASADEEYDKYNTDGYGDALNYDDEEDFDGEDEYWEDGALLNGTVSASPTPESAAEDSGPDLPSLPTDLKTLEPFVHPSELRAGQIITFIELTCDSTTNWQPSSKRFTAEILGPVDEGGQKGETAWKIRVAKRDVPVVERDGEGKRVWGKFEMPEEEEGEGRERERAWSEMGEVRLVRGVEEEGLDGA